MSHYSSFVVRLWVDDRDRVERGYIQHVDSQDGIYFGSLDGMTTFMIAHLHPPANGLSPDDCSLGLRTKGSLDGQV